MDKKYKKSSNASNSNYPPKNIDDDDSKLISDESKQIHRDLSASVKLFTYWAGNIKTYLNKEHELSQLEQEQSQETRINTLVKDIEKFNKKTEKKKSIPIEAFFTEFKRRINKQREEVGDSPIDDLTIDHFKHLTDADIKDIRNVIKTVVVETEIKQENETQNNTETPRDSSCVTLDWFNKKMNELTLNIQKLRDPNGIKPEIKKIKDQLEKIEDFKEFKFDSNPDNEDSTNFAVAEMGFLIEVQSKDNNNPHIEYYHYPVTVTNKNTVNIYDLQNEEFNYFFPENKDAYYGNYIVDDYIKKHTTEDGRSRADPNNDYHSETVLFLLCQQRSFQEKMINRLIRDFQKNNLKLTKLKSLILEIHSARNICSECFKKANYLMEWKTKIPGTRENKTNHFLDYFRNVFTNMLKKNEVLDKNASLDENGVLDLEVKIRYSYDKNIPNASKESHECFTRYQYDDWTECLDYSKVPLYKYTIITSGGVKNYNKDYCYAYNKAVQPIKKIALINIQNNLKKLAEKEYSIQSLALSYLKILIYQKTDKCGASIQTVEKKK